MVFKIGNYDFTNSVVVGSYQINKQDIYTTYTDANTVEHRSIYRTRVSGSLDLYFLRGVEHYANFVKALAALKTTGGYYPLTLTVNNTNSDATINAFLTCEPKRNTIGADDTLDQFTLKVEER